MRKTERCKGIDVEEIQDEPQLERNDNNTQSAYLGRFCEEKFSSTTYHSLQGELVRDCDITNLSQTLYNDIFACLKYHSLK